MNTVDRDTIDLTQLPSLGCSIITLDDSTHTPGHITIGQPTLYILGGGVTISGGTYSGVFRHTGGNLLDIDGLTITHGQYYSDTNPKGGCISSNGSVTLKNSVVDDCKAVGTDMIGAAGGGIFVQNDLNLDHTSITLSAVYNFNDIPAKGGGVYAGGNLHASYATISRNSARDGGGAFVLGGAITIASSTISSNEAQFEGGLYLAGATEITNSTISGNRAAYSVGALQAAGTLKLANSTVAFNHDNNMYSGVAVAGTSLLLESSILAGNGNAAGPADLWVGATTALDASSSNNLIVATTGVQLPAGTIRNCPRLDLLADNGQRMLTHALMPMSPAIDQGNPGSLVFDENGWPRVDGAAADIGAFEWHDSVQTERIFVSGFDGLCDQ